MSKFTALFKQSYQSGNGKLSHSDRASVEQIMMLISTTVPSDISGKTLKSMERDLHAIVYTPDNPYTNREVLREVGNALDSVSSACANWFANPQHPPSNVSRGLREAYQHLNLAITLDNQKE